MYLPAIILYHIFYPVLFVIYFPFYLHHLIKRGGFVDGFGERFGIFKAEKRKALAQLKSPVWIHAVSVGETVAALSFIQRWRERDPKQGFVLSTTTSTGQQIARKKAPEGVVTVYFPLDALPCITASLKAIHPSRVLIFEVEIWPAFLRALAHRRIPTFLVNCRMSDNSAAGYAKHKWFFHRIFDCFQAITVQSERDAKRVRKVLPRADRVHVCGTMKFDQVADREGDDIDAPLNRVFPEDRLVFVAASTHAPEEATVARLAKQLKTEFPTFRTILVPRHQERGGEAVEALKAEGVSHILLTDLRETDEAPQVDVLVVNTTGELMNFMAGADIVFVGKSLGDFGNDGGHNIIEPAIFGKPILFGPAMHNFQFVVEIFLNDESAIQVADEAELLDRLRKLLSDPDERKRYSDASRATVDKRRGAIERTIDIVLHA